MRHLTTFSAAMLLMATATGFTPGTHDLSQGPTPPESAQPGPEHAWLAGDAGTWDIKARIWQPGRAEPMEIDGVSTMTMLWGRYLREEFTIGSGELAMRGIGLIAYDTGAEAFQAVYCLNTGSAISVSTGKRSKDGSVLTLSGTDGGSKRRSVITRKSPDRRLLEYYVTREDGTETRKLEMRYTRRR